MSGEAPAAARKPEPLYTLTLRDKPLGYLVGEVKRRPAVITPCPVCHSHGVRIGADSFLHTVRYDGYNGQAVLNASDACKLDKETVRLNPWKR